jgi:hypothetical protein
MIALSDIPTTIAIVKKLKEQVARLLSLHIIRLLLGYITDVTYAFEVYELQS